MGNLHSLLSMANTYVFCVWEMRSFTMEWPRMCLGCVWGWYFHDRELNHRPSILKNPMYIGRTSSKASTDHPRTPLGVCIPFEDTSPGAHSVDVFILKPSGIHQRITLFPQTRGLQEATRFSLGNVPVICGCQCVVRRSFDYRLGKVRLDIVFWELVHWAHI